MIDRTFLVLPGIGPKKERMLWRAGVHDWETYRNAADADLPGVQRKVRNEHGSLVDTLIDARRAGDLGRLARLFPPREQWRFFPETSPRAGYLDIETTGNDARCTVTVVGVWDPAAGVTHQLIQGDDLDHDNLAALLSRFDMLVTFNGNGFDLPVLRNQYPGAVPERPHLDLRNALSPLGYKGGLKRIEVALGIKRPDEVRGISGFDAVLLWRRYRMRGDRAALQTLVDYNREDVVNLEPLARFATAALHNKLCHYWAGAPEPIVWPGGTAPSELPRECDGIHGVLPEETLDGYAAAPRAG